MARMSLVYCLAVWGILLLFSGRAHAHPAWGIAVDVEREVVYFSDLERIWKVDGEGNKSVFFDDVHTHDLYLDDEGNLYGENHRIIPGTNSWRFRWWKATPSGQVTKLEENEAARWFDRWDREGNRYRLSNTRRSATISKTSPDGKTTLLAGGRFGYVDGSGGEARLRLFGTSV